MAEYINGFDKFGNMPVYTDDRGSTSEPDSGEGGGSSDFSTAEVTFVNRQSKSVSIACVADSEEYNAHGSAASPLPGSSCQAILYKGVSYVFASPLDIDSTSGNIEYDENMNCYVITGDCTITFS